jgi:protein required for attachment to host cells
LADTARARFFKCQFGESRSCHIEELESLIDRWEPHLRGRPQPLHSKTGHAWTAPSHEDEEMRLRFARDVSGWVDRLVKQYGVHRLVVFAPPRFLPDLRRSWVENHHIVEEHEAELMHLTRAQVADHPAVRSALGLARR